MKNGLRLNKTGLKDKEAIEANSTQATINHLGAQHEINPAELP